jgi:pimeloyl-ACP methyl ester carboxylesterase
VGEHRIGEVVLMMVRRGYASVSFGQVHYRHAGRRGAPVLLLLHQAPSTSAMYEALMRELAGEFRLIAPDTPGAGMSDPVPGRPAIGMLAAALLEFMGEIGIDSARVFGHHTGASIGAQIAVSSPDAVSALILSGPPLLDDELRARLPELAARIDAKDDGSHLTAYWDRMRGKDPDAPLALIERETINALTHGDRYGEFYAAVIKHDLAAVLARIRCPALLFAGREDPLYDRVQEAAALLSTARVADVGNGRTYLCDTRADHIAGVLRDFLVREVA